MANDVVLVELNVDAGESPAEPEELYALATTLNLACGGHAGDEASMRAGVALAARYGAKLAAHPSYADREGFGRRARFSSPTAVRADVERQCAALLRFAVEGGAVLRTVKPHGALYHDAAQDPELAAAIIDAARRALPELSVVVGPPEGALRLEAVGAGLDYWVEGFVDRRYDESGQLVPRDRPGAVLQDPAACAAQALALAKTGRYRTLCAHGDTPSAVAIVRAVSEALRAERRLVPR